MPLGRSAGSARQPHRVRMGEKRGAEEAGVLVVTNEALVRRQMRKANWALAIAMLVFVGGFLIGIVFPEDPVTGTISLGALCVGFFIWQLSQYYTRRYGPRSRQDRALERDLKGLDNRYALVNFAVARLPDYVLVGPHGVRVLVARAVDGTVRYQGGRWARVETPRLLSLLVGSPVRNPTVEAEQGVSQMKRYLQDEQPAEGLATVPVSAAIVFTNPNVRLEIEASKDPVLRGDDLRGAIAAERGSVAAEVIGRLRRRLTPPEQPAPQRAAAGKRPGRALRPRRRA